MKNLLSIKNPAIKGLIAFSLKEDIGSGDITSRALPDNKTGIAEIITRENGVICGLPLISAVYAMLDKRIRVTLFTRDGRQVQKDAVVARISGPVSAMLTGERTALNLVSTLSGMATKTRAFAEAVKDTGAGIFDTRKTPPGMRFLAKYAVRMGGGQNHRQGLYDMVLIKDNHIAAMGITQAVQRARKRFPRVKIEVEVETLEELREALKTPAHIIMLDNMPLSQMRQAVRLTQRQKKRPLLEASGGVTLKNVRSIAQTGVDRIAIGGLTHSFKILDISMEMKRK